jgi:type IV secretion system protein VirD4
MNGQPAPGPDNLDVFLIAGAVFLVVMAVLGWSGAELGAFFSHGHLVSLPLLACVKFWARLGHFARDPRLAWPAPESLYLATPALYWFSQVLSSLILAGVGMGVWKLFHLNPEGKGLDRRKRLGVETQGRLARRRDLAPLLISRPVPGRLVLGRFGRALVATEDPKRRGRGLNAALAPVALVGPTRSGKTTTAMSGILRWDGPAVLVSVKADLLAETEAARARLGPIQVFDPAGVTGRASAVWNPLSGAMSISGALRLAASLREAAPRSVGVEANEFFYRSAEGLLAALLLLAANTERSFSDVVRWVVVSDIPSEAAPGTVAPLMRALKADSDPARQAAGVFVADALEGLWRNDHRTISSVYATARSLVWAFVDPTVAAATLYVCLPLIDEGRLRPVLGGALAAVVAAVYDHHMAGRDLDRRLLLVIDEAAAIRPDQLASWAATMAGVGVQLVTIWQSVAQIAAAYGTEHQAILTNHPTKLFYSGMSDQAGLDYVSGLAGEEHLPARLSRGGRRSQWDDDPVTSLPVASPAVLRQMKRGEALLIHGNLAPAHVRPVKWRRRRSARLDGTSRMASRLI